MFDNMERALLTGRYTLYGAKLNNHVATLRQSKRTLKRSDGTMSYSTTNDEAFRLEKEDIRDHDFSPHDSCQLLVGERLHREWRCHKKGFFTWFGLDRWHHHEILQKVAPKQLQVTDHFTWHDKASFAQRKYLLHEGTNGGLQRTLGEWNISMRGVRWPVRGRVESAMRKQLPQSTQEAFDMFVTSNALCP